MSAFSILSLLVFAVGFLIFCEEGIRSALYSSGKIKTDSSDKMYDVSFSLGSIGLIFFIISMI